MSAPNLGKRPLSPFMLGSAYRFQMSSVTSLIHRATGTALFFSFLAIVLWLASAAVGGAFFATMNWLLTSWLGKLALLLSLWGVWYHLLNGIRNLAWDLGYGFDLDVAAKTGWAVIIGSVILTIVTVLMS